MLARHAVQQKPASEQAKKGRNPAATARELDSGLISIPAAAAELGIDVKRLRGYVLRDSVRLGDPVGSVPLDVVYESTLEPLRARLARERA